MPFALRLFRLNIYNSYYRTQVCNDFALIPAEESQRWMQQYPMRLVPTPGTFELLWVAAGLAEPLQVLKEKTYGKKLTFHLILKNPDALCFSELSIDRGEAYYFHNQGTGSKLHQEAYVSQVDKTVIPKIGKNPFKLEKPFLAIVDIYLEGLWKEEALDIHQLPVDYSIHIKARETIWRYYAVDKPLVPRVP